MLTSWLVSLWLIGCGGSSERPEGVPAEAAHIAFVEGQIVVGGEAVAPVDALEGNPTDQVFAPLQQALTGDGPLWIDLPADTPWYRVRRVLGSGKAAGRRDTWLSVHGTDEALHPEPPPRFGLAGTCPDGPMQVKGVQPLITLAPQRGPEGAWVLGSARFLPVVELGGETKPVDGLPDRCLRPPDCAALYPEGTLRTTCEQAAKDPGDRRVRLGGSYGCLLPIAKAPDEIGTWRSELSEVGPALGLQDQPLLLVMPEARTRWDGVLALLGGLSDGGRATPSVGTPLIEGNDGPPVCNAEVRTSAQLQAAAATWVGGLNATLQPPEAPEEDGGDE